jgi:hypothetical protein
MSEKRDSEPQVRYERRVKQTETQRVYNSGGVLIVKPLSPESCCIYGRGTKWCISMKQSHRNWSTYCAKNICFYIIINHNIPSNHPLHKTLAEVSETGRIIWWNALDEIIEKPHFINL